MERCYLLDENLARLARSYPDTKFLRAKAAALGFASLSTPSKSKPAGSRLKSTREEDEDDPYGYDEKDGDEDEDAEDFGDDNVDLDMLPTMLVYRDGELVHNWVRVDWEAGSTGIEELLDKYVQRICNHRPLANLFLRHHILPQGHGNTVNLGFPSDEEDFDLMWSDDEDVNH